MDINVLVDEYGQQGVNEILADSGLTNSKSFKCLYHDHDDKSPSMGLIKGTNKFWCAGCQRGYDIINHYQEHYNMTEHESINKLKETLGYETEDVSQDEINTRVSKAEKEKKDLEELASIFKFREISIKTLLENGIKNHSKDNEDIIGVNYKVDGEDKGYQWVKVNSLKQKMYGSKDLLFNYDNIKDKEEIIICFDIIDYLTLYELGYRNICSKSTKGNGFVANYYDDLQKHKSIKLIFGGDISNTTFNGIIKRIGIEIVKYKRLESFSTINHAVVAGIDVNKEIKESIFVKIKSLTRLEDISFETAKQETMRFGQENGALSGLDWILDGVRLSTFNLLIGRDNEGKTSVAQQIMCNLIEQGHGVFLYDGESNQATLKRKFYLRLVGNDKNALIKKRINIRPIMYPKPPVVSALEEWHRNKLIVRGSESETDIYEDMKISYRRYGTKVFFIDNMMSLLVLGKHNRNEAQSMMIEKLKRFAKSLKISIFMIAHARENEENTTLFKTDTSGSKEITDKADNIMSFMRDFKERHDKFDKETLPDNVTNLMDVLKNREFGEFSRFKFQFNHNTGNFDEIFKDNIRVNKYSWKQYLSDDIDKNTYEKIEVKKGLENSPF